MDDLQNKTLQRKFPNGYFTLIDAINDASIKDLLPQNYLPQIQLMDNSHSDKKTIFIQKDALDISTYNCIRKVCYVYLDKHGANKTSRDISFIQVGLNCEGFLIRLSVPKNNMVSHNITVDYFIDISKIFYKEAQLISRNSKDQIIYDNHLIFENLDFSQYTDVNFSETIREFSLNKDEIFETYFN